MARPELAAAAPLADAAAVAEALPIVRELIQDRASIRHSDELDGATLAWAGTLLADDLASPPIAQRVSALDLVLGDLRPGAPVMISGRLEDAASANVGEQTWERLLVSLEDGQFAQVLAPPTARAVPIGAMVQVVGRHLGWSVLPAGSANQHLPLLLGRAVNVAAAGPEATNPYRGIVTMPPDLWQDVDDERVVVETRPYFYLLGQVNTDRTEPERFAAEALDGNANADRIHRQPDQHRGKAYRVSGYVYRAWEDATVASEQPWGISRVVRVLLWNRDSGEVTEKVNGKTVLKTQILRLYELAMITDQPLPQTMERITAVGRFLKFHAVPVELNRERDRANAVERQSDKVYTFMFCSGPAILLPPPPKYSFSGFAIAACVGLLLIVGLIMVLWRRDNRTAGEVMGLIRKLRHTRRAVMKAKTDPPAPVAEPGPPPAT
jgi:hypothetical protein